MNSLIQTYRLILIVKCLAKHDCLDLFDPLVKKWRGARAGIWASNFLWRKKSSNDQSALSQGNRLANALMALGPSFIKFGQALSVREDIVGKKISQELSQLQDQIPPFDSENAKLIVEAELEAPIDSLFKSFDPVPIAAASIAQVHFAVTHQGDPVAVKLLRPGITEQFERDLDLFDTIARMIERHSPKSLRLRPRQVVETIREWIETELDLRLEGAAASELRNNFIDEPKFHVPQVYWELTGQKILTTERIDGFRFDDILSLKNTGHNPTDILQLSTRIFFLQVFRDGFFHADVHPGNLLVKADGTLCPVDFGIMGRIDRKTRIFLADTLIGFLTSDYDRVSEAHFNIGYVPAHKSRSQFTQALRAIGAPIIDKPLFEISIAKLLQQLFQTTERFDMPLQPELLLLQKTMLVAEGVGRKLDDSVNMWLLERPLIEEWYKQNFNPKAQLAELARESGVILKNLPTTLSRAEAALNKLSTLAEHAERGDHRPSSPPKPPDILPPLRDKNSKGSVLEILFHPKMILMFAVFGLLYYLYKNG